MMLPHQLILPSGTCRRNPRHELRQRNKSTGPGVIEFCLTCSLGYENILQASNGDEEQADRFVKFLQR